MAAKSKETFSNLAFFFSILVFVMSVLGLILSPHVSARLYSGKEEIERNSNDTYGLTGVHYSGTVLLESSKDGEGKDFRIKEYTVKVTVKSLTDGKIVDEQTLTLKGGQDFEFEKEYPDTPEGVAVECKLISCVKKYPSTYILNFVITGLSALAVALGLLSEICSKKKAGCAEITEVSAQ